MTHFCTSKATNPLLETPKPQSLTQPTIIADIPFSSYHPSLNSVKISFPYTDNITYISVFCQYLLNFF